MEQLLFKYAKRNLSAPVRHMGCSLSTHCMIWCRIVMLCCEATTAVRNAVVSTQLACSSVSDVGITTPHLQDYPFSLDEATGRLALQFDATAQRVSPEDIKSIQREEVAPWLIALPALFDTTVRRCCELTTGWFV
jgi:hypothetical protein